MSERRFDISHGVALGIGALGCWLVFQFGPIPIDPRAITLRYDSVMTAHAAFDAGQRTADSLAALTRDSLQAQLDASRLRPSRPSIRTILDSVILTDTTAQRQLAEATATLEAHHAADSIALAHERRAADSALAFERRENTRLLLTVIPALQAQRDSAWADAREQARGRAAAERKANRRVMLGWCSGGSVAQSNLGLTVGLCYRIL